VAKRARVIQTIIDDIDGQELPEGEGQSITYQWRGQHYEIDVSDQHASQLDQALDPIIRASRKHKPESGPKRIRAGAERADTPRAITGGTSGDSGSERISGRQGQRIRAEIREWAKGNGFPDAPERGRLTHEIKTAYYAAHPEAIRV
jgi:hypothetical protein